MLLLTLEQTSIPFSSPPFARALFILLSVLLLRIARLARFAEALCHVRLLVTCTLSLPLASSSFSVRDVSLHICKHTYPAKGTTQRRRMMNTTLLVQDVDEIQSAVDRWYCQSSSNLQASHAAFLAQLRQLQEHLGLDAGAPALSVHADAMITPPRHMYPSDDNNSGSPPMASPPISRGQLNYDHLVDEVVSKNVAMSPFNPEEEAERRRRPNAESVRTPSTPPEDYNGPCQVLVEFKRKRMLQYESPYYVAPGEHVVVGGDRGEDIGLVTHTWKGAEAHQLGENRDKGVGKVLRVASVLEVTQLQGVQTELETRAVEVAQEKVQENGLPMRIVDAEYQFDRRKLTFYYQSMHRLDFRTLVRDLYKTFRARIWMEPDTSF
ncbi:conserved hypothetical protein [Leishmania braziliensis MHOM/BR/75/M2904]|uniref:PSP1 C-terminal domain-containing protein n=2 Tax=Leishmania braziliensis TaxID=5660 RepID=A4H9U4_LEIBR|nr:conserved hypothetical protein [Leishmania braziliensis MHOM/BR/75/M2904]CAJ2468257.1 unnamed protein product [Leishmania braziliensis]CAM38170.1 conserved hypothetical protein [Leishmania braziliensis MHOM/BR/75/M2904]